MRYKGDENINYKVVRSGSNGNCVIINDVMIDCGVPIKYIEKDLYHVKYLLLTHIHSDHINKATLKGIKKFHPRIRIIGNYEVHLIHNVDEISRDNEKIKTKDYTFLPFPCVHDCVVQGYTWEYDGKSIIYATDTASLEHAPKIKYDYLFIESNHDEKKIEQVMGQQIGSYNAFESAKRHLSTQESKRFYYFNRKDSNSKWIELHKSKRFY